MTDGGVQVERVGDAPIITPASHPSIGTNIQGPSVIRAPAWLPDPLGRYLCYFADHKGSFIRLAYADAIEGPWTIHEPGSLHLADSGFLVEDLAIDAETLERGSPAAIERRSVTSCRSRSSMTSSPPTSPRPTCTSTMTDARS